jgi:DNA excision repair protein ERCC-4
MSLQNAITRVAGRGAAPKALPRRLVVDMREFMSSLPAVLHQQVGSAIPAWG